MVNDDKVRHACCHEAHSPFHPCRVCCYILKMWQIPQEKRYSSGLVSLMRCCLVVDPERRPTIGQVTVIACVFVTRGWPTQGLVGSRGIWGWGGGVNALLL